MRLRKIVELTEEEKKTLKEAKEILERIEDFMLELDSYNSNVVSRYEINECIKSLEKVKTIEEVY